MRSQQYSKPLMLKFNAQFISTSIEKREEKKAL